MASFVHWRGSLRLESEKRSFGIRPNLLGSLELSSMQDVSAAKLLLSVRSIALNESDSSYDNCLERSPPRTIFTYQADDFATHLKTDDPYADITEIRLRKVSIGSHDLDGDTKGRLTPDGPEAWAGADFLSMSKKATILKEEGSSVLCRDSPVPSPPFNKDFVGDTLPDGVELKFVLRKKFSWKSFPKLENYLLDHRQQYLEYSNSLNYTKAQKDYSVQQQAHARSVGIGCGRRVHL